MIHPCFSSFIQFCRRLELAEPWCDCTRIRNGFSGPASPATAFEQISRVHSAEELLAAGLAERGSDGRIAMHRFLAEPGVIGLAIADAASAIHSMITDSGALPGEQLPLLAMINDPQTDRLLPATDGAMIMTADLREAMLLRSLGFAAASVAGLDSIDLRDLHRVLATRPSTNHSQTLRPPPPAQTVQSQNGNSGATSPRLIDLFGGGPQAMPVTRAAPSTAHAPSGDESSNAVSADAGELRLVIAGWHPTARTLALPAQTLNLLEYCRMIFAFHDPDLHEVLDEFEVWIPSQKNLALLALALGRKEHNWVVEALRQSLTSDCRSLAAFFNAPTPANPGTELADAWARLTESWARDPRLDPGGNERRKMRADLQMKLHQYITTPLLREAQSADTYVDRALYLHLSQHSQLGTWQTARILEEMAAEHWSPREPNDHAQSEMLANCTRIITIARELKR